LRYIQIDTISFTDVNGNSYAIKDMREIPDYVKMTTVDVKTSDKIDEIASRNMVYREGAEDQSFKIFDMNRVKLHETEYDLGRVKLLEIPV
jgi:hypothetical protein